ncbi:hypothetical protein [Streptomyces albidoflavus]|uniref:hypothetical protein n=1 Tax=Streptomyces albidoflavus TaxID=1886 RepID=UPI0013EEE154
MTLLLTRNDLETLLDPADCLAALRRVVCLFSGVDGGLLALLDSATVTAWRTGLAATLGTHLPASPARPRARRSG